MAWSMAGVHVAGTMVANTMGNFSKVDSMGLASWRGLMAGSTKVNIGRTINMERAQLFGLMVPSSVASGLMAKSKAMARTPTVRAWPDKAVGCKTSRRTVMMC